MRKEISSCHCPSKFLSPKFPLGHQTRPSLFTRHFPPRQFCRNRQLVLMRRAFGALGRAPVWGPEQKTQTQLGHNLVFSAFAQRSAFPSSFIGGGGGPHLSCHASASPPGAGSSRAAGGTSAPRPPRSCGRCRWPTQTASLLVSIVGINDHPVLLFENCFSGPWCYHARIFPFTIKSVGWNGPVAPKAMGCTQWLLA